MDLLRHAAFLIACASAVFAIASIGGAFSDHLDVLTHFTPFFLAGGVVSLAVGLAIGPGQGWRESLFFAAVAIVFPAAAMGPDILAALTASRAPASAADLKVIQFNVWSKNRDPAATAEWIARQDADVVIMEETQEDGAAVPALLRRVYPYQTGCIPIFACATVILSKAKPIAAGAFAAPDENSLHSGAWARFGAGSEAGYTVVGAHLSWPFPPGDQQAEAQRLTDEVVQFDRRTTILAGDFNSTPWSFTLRRLGVDLGLERRTHAVFSWPAGTYGHRLRLRSPVPLLPIDHVFAGSAWKTVRVERGPKLGSDHYPVIVVLSRD